MVWECHAIHNAVAATAATTTTGLKLIKAGSRFLLFTMLLLLLLIWCVYIYNVCFVFFAHCAEGGKCAALNEQCYLCKRECQHKIEFRFSFHGISIKAFSISWNIIMFIRMCMECVFPLSPCQRANFGNSK